MTTETKKKTAKKKPGEQVSVKDFSENDPIEGLPPEVELIGVATIEPATTVQRVLCELQQKLKVPKDLRNDYAEFDYRSAEGILAKLMPLCGEYAEDGLFVTYKLRDNIVAIGGRVYVESTGTLRVNNEVDENIAFARETERKTKSDEAQLTGAASSYARKYCMQGHFQLQGNDDTVDLDSLNPADIEADRREDYIDGVTAKLDLATTVLQLNELTNPLMKEAEELGFLTELKTIHNLIKAGLDKPSEDK